MPIPKSPVNLRASGMRETAYELLRDAIVRQELAPGERLTDEDLEARFGTTRSAVRAALAELESEWLVRIVPRKGTYVTELDLSRGLQAVEVLVGLTSRAVQDSEGRLTQEHLDRLRVYRDRWLRTEDTMTEAFLASHEESQLLGVFFEAAGNPELDRLRAWVLPCTMRVRYHFASTSGIEAASSLRIQRGVIAAVMNGDFAGAAERIWETTAPFGEYRTKTLDAGAPRAGVALTRDLVADTIERAIVDRTLLPGEPLPETDLMAWLGVSHTPVRQALDALANRGLVDQHVNKSARVAQLDPETIKSTFVAYGVLIRIAYRRAMRLDSDRLLAALRPHHDRYRMEPDAPVSEINAGINLALFEFTGAQVLADLSERLAARLTWYVADGWDKHARPDAIRLVEETRDAIAANDDAAMDRIVREAYEELPFAEHP